MHSRIFWLWSVLILCIATLVRVRLLNADLSIDEVWSLKLASQMHSPLDVFSLHSDNNHYLNTLWLYFLGPLQPFWIYRLAAFLCGMTLIALVMKEGWKKRPLLGMILGLAFALSPFFVFYSAQARGYGPATLFAYLAFLSMQTLIHKQQMRDALVFGLLCIIGFLWQLVFIHVYIALLVWSLVALWNAPGNGSYTLPAAAHLPVLAFLLLLSKVDLSFLQIGGAPAATLLDAGKEAVMLLSGIPVEHPLNVLCGLGATVLVLMGVQHTFHTSKSMGIFLVTLLCISPVLWMLSIHPPFIYARYFAPLMIWILWILCAPVAENIHSKHVWISNVTLLLFSMFLASATLADLHLADHKRDYTHALRTLIQTAERNPITIGSHTDFRTELLLWLYAMRIQTDKEIRYLNREARQTTAPDFWFVDGEIESGTDILIKEEKTYEVIGNTMKGKPKWIILKARS